MFGDFGKEESVLTFGATADVKMKSLLEKVRANDVTGPDAAKKAAFSRLVRTSTTNTPLPPVLLSEGLPRPNNMHFLPSLASSSLTSYDLNRKSRLQFNVGQSHVHIPRQEMGGTFSSTSLEPLGTRHTLSSFNYLRAPKAPQLSSKHVSGLGVGPSLRYDINQGGSSTLPNRSLGSLPPRDSSVWSLDAALRGNLANMPRGTTSRSRTLPPLLHQRREEMPSSAAFRHGQNLGGGTWDSTSWKHRPLSRPFGAHNREQSPTFSYGTHLRRAVLSDVTVSPMPEGSLHGVLDKVESDEPDASPDVSSVNDNSASLDHAEAKEALAFSDGISGDIGNSPIHADDEIQMSTPTMVSDDVPWTKEGKLTEDVFHEDGTEICA